MVPYNKYEPLQGGQVYGCMPFLLLQHLIKNHANAHYYNNYICDAVCCLRLGPTVTSLQSQQQHQQQTWHHKRCCIFYAISSSSSSHTCGKCRVHSTYPPLGTGVQDTETVRPVRISASGSQRTSLWWACWVASWSMDSASGKRLSQCSGWLAGCVGLPGPCPMVSTKVNTAFCLYIIHGTVCTSFCSSFRDLRLSWLAFLDTVRVLETYKGFIELSYSAHH